MKARRKLRTLLAVVLSVGALFFLLRPVLNKLAKRVLADQLSQRLSARVAISDLRLSLLPLQAEAFGISIERTEGPLRYIGVDSILIRPGLGLSLSKMSVSELTIQHPVLRFEVGMATPTGAAKAPGEGFRIPFLKDLLRVELQRVKIDDAELSFSLPAEQLELRIGARAFSFGSEEDRERMQWQGGGEILHQGKSYRLDTVSIVAEREDERFSVTNFELAGAGASLRIHGNLLPEADIKILFEADLKKTRETLGPLLLLRKAEEVRGTFHFEASGKGKLSELVWAGNLALTDAVFGARQIPSFRADFGIRGDRLQRFKATARIGAGRLDVDVAPLRQGEGRVTLVARNILYDDIHPLISPQIPSHLDAVADLRAVGTLTSRPWGFRGEYTLTSPRLVLRLPPRLQTFLPLEFRAIRSEGKLSWKLGESLSFLDAKVQATGVEATYRFDFDPRSGTSGNWNGKVTGLEHLLAGGNLSGTGGVTGDLHAHHGKYDVTLRLALPMVSVQQKSYAVTGEIFITETHSELRQLRAASGNEVLGVDAKIPTGVHHAGDGVLVLKSFDLAWLSGAVSRPYPALSGMEGNVSGRFEWHDVGQGLSGGLRISLSGFRYRGIGLGHGTLVADLERGEWVIQKGEVGDGERRVSVNGVVGPEGYRGFTFEFTRMPLESFGVPRGLETYLASANGSGTLSGPLEDPRLEGSLQLYGGKQREDLRSTGTGKAEGLLSDLGWWVELEGGALRVRGRADLRRNSFLDLEGTWTDFSLSPFLPPSEASASGTATLSGRRTPSGWRWNGSAVVEAFRLRQGEWSLSLASAGRVEIHDNRWSVPSFHLTGSASELEISGQGDLEKELEASIDGHFSLHGLGLLIPGIVRGEGSAKVQARARGSLRAPLFTGEMSVTNGVLQFKGLPQSITGLNAQARLVQRKLFLDQFSGSFGDGRVTASGELGLANGQTPATVAVRARVERVSVRLPRWLPSTSSGELVLSGELRRPTLRGDLLVHQAVYQDEWDWKSKILTFGRKAPASRVALESEEHLLLDLSLHTEGDTLLIRNSIATARMRGDLRLSGSDRAIGLLGRIEVSQGAVKFQSNTFELVSGMVLFDRPRAVHASFDVTARTSVQEVDIFLDLRTQGDEVVAFLSSQPPKDEMNILALLTLGVDTEELMSSGAAGASMGSAVIPSVLSGPFQEKMETGLKKAGLVDSFEFSPYFSDSTNTTGLKMIVGRQLFPKVRLLYSTNLFDPSTENSFRVEQVVNRHVAVQASAGEEPEHNQGEMDFGLDVEFKFEF